MKTPSARSDQPLPNRLTHSDLFVVLALAALAAAATFLGSRGIDEAVALHAPINTWFQADCPRVVDNLTDARSVQSRAAVHPLFAFTHYPLVAALRATCGLSPIVAVRVVRALTAGLCAAVFFVILRRIGAGRCVATLYTLLAGTISASMFWFVVPETYPPGLLSILLALLLVAGDPNGKRSPAWDVAVVVLTFAFTDHERRRGNPGHAAATIASPGSADLRIRARRAARADGVATRAVSFRRPISLFERRVGVCAQTRSGRTAARVGGVLFARAGNAKDRDDSGR